MDGNFKLKKAIIIAIAVMGTAYSMHSKAIGLGDIAVNSYLGQPLAANIKVSGLDKKMTGSCFTVNSDDLNAIREVSFQLNHLGNGEGVLALSSKRAVYEPIASLTVVSHCDTTFTRQYNLLIDPSITGDSVLAYQQDELNNDSVAALRSAETADEPSNVVATSEAPVKAVAKKSRASTAKSVNRSKLATRSNNQTTTPTAEAVKQNSVSAMPAQPKLTISGGNLPNTSFDFSSMKLNFDKKINVNRQANPQAYAAEAAFADELTMMNNRMTHLDKQLSSLNAQNASLKQANVAIQSELTEVKHQNDFLSILALSLGGALLASGFFFADWLRRRNAAIRAEKEQALWQHMQEEQAYADTTDNEHAMNDDFASSLSKDAFEEATPNSMRAADNTYAFQSNYNGNASAEIVEEASNIKEDAELFLAHGRTGLAITLLQNHLSEAPKESASTWMFLLDLLAKEGMQAEFETAAAECRKHFNVQLDDFSKPLSDCNTLESFERISLQLQKVWGTAEAITFLDELIYNTRLEPRMGFEKAVFEEILLLREIAHEEIQLAEVISFNAAKAPRKETKEEKISMTPYLPEIEMTPEFDLLSNQFSLENKEQAPVNQVEEQFEFELLDIAHR